MLLVKLLFAGIKLVVSALQFKELIVSTALDYLALLKHHNGVRVADGRETVSNNEGSACRHKSVHTVLNVTLGTGVDRARRLVEDENRSF